MAKKTRRTQTAEPLPERGPTFPPPPGLGGIVGQDRAVETLRRALGSGRLHHAWIFHGPAGVGKFTTAVSFAAAALDPTTIQPGREVPEPDPDSRTQQLILAGSHPDLHVITKELARFSDDKQVRDRKLITIPKAVIDEHLIRPSALSASVRAGGAVDKVFVVDEAELLDRSPTNAPVQNALLKTLEEPPAGTLIILVTSEEERLLPTIRSRCQRVAFVRLDERDMQKWLGASDDAAGLELSEQDRRWLIRYAQGSPGAFLAAARGRVHEWHARLAPMFEALSRGEYPAGLAAMLHEHVDTWATEWVASHQNASKDAANKAGARQMFRLLGEIVRDGLRADIEQGTDRAESWLAVSDLLREAERTADANVQLPFVFEHVVAEWGRVFRAGGAEGIGAAGRARAGRA